MTPIVTNVKGKGFLFKNNRKLEKRTYYSTSRTTPYTG